MKLITKVNVSCILVILSTFTGCVKNKTPIEITSSIYHSSMDKITEIMVHDIFSPPVASRIFAYPNVAAYEIIASTNKKYNSLSGQIHDLEIIPQYDKTKGVLNSRLAALIAFMNVGKNLIFSEDKMDNFVDSLYNIWEKKNKREFENAKEYGLKVANHIKLWLNNDNYNQTRTMPKYTLNINDPARWQPTPPSYTDGIEPHWNKIRTFVIDSASQFRPISIPEFSLEKRSKFYKELKEVYDIGNRLNKKGNNSEEIAIAQFWDCNPYLTSTKGHLMFAVKKITPGAHWIGITKIACKKSKSDFEATVFAYTKTSLAIADAFISCWDEKYRSNLIRPETLINQHIDENWKPVLQTPPFPEYTSGHSVVSGAAATILTSIFGKKFDFNDTTETDYGLPIRSFDSFHSAAKEAAISRMYGGIHYRMAVEIGLNQGISLGKFVISKLKMKNK